MRLACGHMEFGGVVVCADERSNALFRNQTTPLRGHCSWFLLGSWSLGGFGGVWGVLGEFEWSLGGLGGVWGVLGEFGGFLESLGAFGGVRVVLGEFGVNLEGVWGFLGSLGWFWGNLEGF